MFCVPEAQGSLTRGPTVRTHTSIGRAVAPRRCTPGELPIEKIWEKSAPIAHPMPVWMYCGLSCKQCGSDTLTEADLDRIARHEGPAAPERVWGVAGNPLHSNPHPHSHPHPHPDPSQAPTPNGSTTYQATNSTPAHGTRPSTLR